MTLKTLLAATALAFAAGVSHAADSVVTLTPNSDGVLSGMFTQSFDAYTADGSPDFIDNFTFNPASFSGLVSVTLHGISGPVSFLVGSINDQGFGVAPDADTTADFSFQAFVTDDVPLTVTVFRTVFDAFGNGAAGPGTYTGSITAAVPEPQTYALLLAGLAGVGVMARRRKAAAR